MEKVIMQNSRDEKEIQEEREEIKFGYGASIVFLIFIAFVIYISLTR